MSVTTISIGTAGTQSGDKVRDAFSIVNENFANLMLGDLKNYQATSYSVSSEVSTYSNATLLSNIPAGTYLVLLSANFQPGQEGADHGDVYLYNATASAALGIAMRSNVEVENSFNQTAIGLYTYSASAWQLKLYYRDGDDLSSGISISGNVVLIRVS